MKGELEEALAQVPLEGLVIARPSLLVGNRKLLAQPVRPLERAGLVLSWVLGPLVPANYRPIAATDVARALLARVPTAKRREVLLSGAMHDAAI